MLAFRGRVLRVHFDWDAPPPGMTAAVVEKNSLVRALRIHAP